MLRVSGHVCRGERLGLQLLPRYSGWKKPSLPVEDTLLTSHKYFFPGFLSRESPGYHRTTVSDFMSRISTSDLRRSWKNWEVTSMTSKKKKKMNSEKLLELQMGIVSLLKINSILDINSLCVLSCIKFQSCFICVTVIWIVYNIHWLQLY